MADALENAQSENTRRNYAGQYRKFRAWCEREDQSALPAQPEVVAAYAAELAEDGKSMSTIRLAVAAVVDAHRRVGLESPQTAGISETLRGLSRQVGVSQKQARPLDADAPVFGLSMSQISRRVDDMARAAGLGEGYSGHSGRVGLAIRMTRRGAPLQAVQTHGTLEVSSNAREVHEGRESVGGAGVVSLKDVIWLQEGTPPGPLRCGLVGRCEPQENGSVTASSSQRATTGLQLNPA